VAAQTVALVLTVHIETVALLLVARIEPVIVFY
jgi:hypothetical protein